MEEFHHHIWIKKVIIRLSNCFMYFLEKCFPDDLLIWWRTGIQLHWFTWKQKWKAHSDRGPTKLFSKVLFPTRQPNFLRINPCRVGFLISWIAHPSCNTGNKYNHSIVWTQPPQTITPSQSTKVATNASGSIRFCFLLALYPVLHTFTTRIYAYGIFAPWTLKTGLRRNHRAKVGLSSLNNTHSLTWPKPLRPQAKRAWCNAQ